VCIFAVSIVAVSIAAETGDQEFDNAGSFVPGSIVTEYFLRCPLL
jgi:hypothetical protein